MKYVLKEIQANPMCCNALITLVAEVPTVKMPKDNNKFPAEIEVPVIKGWLFHVVSFLLHCRLEQVTFTWAIVPFCSTSTSTSLDLHDGQNLRRANSCVRKTINFGLFSNWYLCGIL